MALDPAFLDELRARTPISSLIARRVKLARSGRNWKGCCPFHGEKTPSFYVYDDHFHCFGCGVHGDAISFVMQSEGKSFPEAVESLASEAGLEVPRASPQAREEAVRVRGLGEVLDAAQRIWSRALHEPAGRAGLDYLRKRGLTDQTIESFGLGWAGDGRGALTAALGQQGITPEVMAEAGLMRFDEDGRPKGELYWSRVTFPICDRRGALVSFGGRILGDGQPKYLNGPETALFSKRRLLFGFDRARAALRAPKPRDAAPIELMVVEGYMDVIALHQAGFVGAVAPLGTALTAEQLELIWQSAPMPILCFDGDAAGRRAAVRATEIAMPLLAAGRSLRFCMLPDGEDPDSLLRQGGPDAMGALLAGAQPLSAVLFDLLAENVPPDAGPEQRAALRTRLAEVAALVPDKGLASEYRATLLDRFFEVFRGRGRKGGGPGGGRGGGAGARNGQAFASRSQGGVPQGMPVMATSGAERQLTLLTALVLREPRLLASVEDAWCQLDLPSDLSELREAVLDYAADRHDLEAEAMMRELTEAGLAPKAEAVLRSSFLPRGDRSRDGLFDVAPEVQWWHFYAALNREAFKAEIARDAEALCRDGAEPEAWDRLRSRLEAQALLSKLEDGSF